MTNNSTDTSINVSSAVADRRRMTGKRWSQLAAMLRVKA